MIRTDCNTSFTDLGTLFQYYFYSCETTKTVRNEMNFLILPKQKDFDPTKITFKILSLCF